MRHDGGIDTNELSTVLSKSNIKPSAEITKKFNELDTNKNGKLEESDFSTATEGGEDYFLPGLGGIIGKALPVLLENWPQISDLGGKILKGVLNQQAPPQPGAEGQQKPDKKEDDEDVSEEAEYYTPSQELEMPKLIDGASITDQGAEGGKKGKKGKNNGETQSSLSICAFFILRLSACLREGEETTRGRNGGERQFRR